MITIEDFFKDKESIRSCSIYKHFEYKDPSESFLIELDYCYLYGWGIDISFKKDPSMRIFIEDDSQDASGVLAILNKCEPILHMLEINCPTTNKLSLLDFVKTSNNRYQYNDSQKSLDLCIIEDKETSGEFLISSKTLGSKIDFFFKKSSIDQIISLFNVCMEII